MTAGEAEAFAVGVSIWDEILPAAARDDPEAGARRYCACLMLHQLYSVLVAEPRRSHGQLKALLNFLSKQPM